MEIPESMRDELGTWNNGAGIELEAWIGCEGRFALAVGYASIFWPMFGLRGDYILRQGVPESAVLDFENQEGSTLLSVEATLNHLHLANIHYHGCLDGSADKLVALGSKLREIYEAKLQWQFPERPCIVKLFLPDDPNALEKHELSFWQHAHDIALT